MINDDILDMIFKRDDIRGIWPFQLTSELAFLAGAAFVELLKSRQGKTAFSVAVGYDARIGSPDLARAVCGGIERHGGKPVALGMVSSEQLYFACGRYPERYEGGVMVTASHNPAEYNGMKFVLAGGAPLGGDDLLELRRLMLQLAHNIEHNNLGDDFAGFLLEKSGAGRVNPAAHPLKIVVAAGNGVGCRAFAPLASRLTAKGAFEFVELDPEPDGKFPQGVPNPLLPEYMERLGAKVKECGAVLGIGFDGDADRAGFVDGNGQEITPPMVYALVAQFKLNTWNDATVRPLLMRNLCCSRLILDMAKGRADVLDTPVGHGQIKRLMRHPDYAGRVVFAGEHSGHYFYPEFFSVDSGMMTGLIVMQLALQLEKDGASLAGMLADWRQKYVWSGEINFTLPSRDDIFPKMKAIWSNMAKISGMKRYEVALDEQLNLYRVFEGKIEYEPANMKFPDLKGICEYGDHDGWWFVVRPSGNEPKLRLNVEAWGENATENCQKYTDMIRGLILES